MKTEHGKIEGDVVVEDEQTLHGIITGNAFIKEGGKLFLHGILHHDLVLEKGGEAYIYGLVAGNAVNKGGRLEIYGTVCGKIIKESGKTDVNSESGEEDTKGFLKLMTEILDALKLMMEIISETKISINIQINDNAIKGQDKG